MSESSEDFVVGIDLGTTNSAIAAVVNGELIVVPVAGNPTMPSAVGIDPAGKLVVGQPAKNQQVSSPESTILSIKRHMGTDHRESLGGREFGPEEISALILGELKRAAEAHFGRPVKRAVITVPAFFDEAQRKATQAAGALAGLEVLRIINEPTAAALAYGGGEAMKEGETMLVYDLGGGTFDVSVVRVEKGIVEVRASFGDTKLGGDDFDDALVEVGVAKFVAQAGAPDLSPAARRRLKGVMEAAKIRLSDEPFAPVHEDYLADSFHLVTEIARPEYESLIDPMLAKTMACVRRAMADAGVAAGDIDRIMMVGGATRTPAVHALLRRELGKPPRHEINPDLIVAMGAAIQGAALAGAPAPAILIDITAHTYSTTALDDFTGLVCCPIIPRGTPLPVTRAEGFETVMDNQREVEVTVYQGESFSPERNTLLGSFRMKDLSRVPAGNEVVIRFQLDLNGLLTATGIEKSTGRSERLVVDTHGGHRLNLDAARANLAELFADEDEDDDYDGFEDDGEGDDEFEEEEEADAGEPDAADDQAPAGLPATARDFRRRAEALLERGVADKDAAEIRQCLDLFGEAIRDRDWPQVNRLADTLSDILFYLED